MGGWRPKVTYATLLREEWQYATGVKGTESRGQVI